MAKELRVGIIGFDTSHVPAFTRLLNDDKDPFHIPGARVVAGFPSFSPDMQLSYSRVEGFKKELVEKWNVKIVGSIEELVGLVDAVFLESVDGRRHLKEAGPVIESRKPVFIDKPIAACYKDAYEIFKLAGERKCPVFSSSALRFDANIVKLKEDPGLGRVVGCDAFTLAALDPANPGLFWYGIHGVEILFTFMGTGCKRVCSHTNKGVTFVTAEWSDGRIGTVRGMRETALPFGATVFGEKKMETAVFSAEVPFYAQLLKQIVPFIQGKSIPVAPEETLEVAAFMETAMVSEKEGRQVDLEEVKT